ncbi:MEI2 C-terminal RRM only like 1 [Theobroma cacao]|uniref:MEI2 C-terminal RRM only like 1 n=1 Tax=Theobroma cacao TaxID=3641 RepID=A0A061FHP6_THECC|nr:MEI2 C-terminal RRM only like 1 [Theobroma cacao]
MSASSSPVKTSNSKPLNPSALSYEPQSMQPIAKPHYPQDKIYLPHQFHFERNQNEAPLHLPQPQVPVLQSVFLPVVLPDFCPRPSFGYYSSWCWENKEECLNLYNSEKQPYPRIKVFDSPNSIPYDGMNYGSERIVGNKKKGKCGSVPPSLKPRSEYPMHSPVWVPRKADDEKIGASSNVQGGGSPLCPLVPAEEQMKFDGKTSIMIKNVPNHFNCHEPVIIYVSGLLYGPKSLEEEESVLPFVLQVFFVTSVGCSCTEVIRSDLQRMLDRFCQIENRKAQPVSSFCKSAYDFLYLPMDFGFHLNLGFAFVNFTSPDAASRFSRAFNRREWSYGDTRSKICEISVAKLQGKGALKEQFERSSFPCHTNDYLPVVFSPPRDGFTRSRPTIVGRRTHTSATSKGEKVMIMTRRKNRKA